MEFRILGPLEVSDGAEQVALGGPKQRLVLAVLLSSPNEPVPLDALIDRVWGDEPPEAARNAMQSYVSRLRKALGDGRIEAAPGGYVLGAREGELDAERFERALREARRRREDPAAALSLLDEALGLWRGPAFADLAEEPSLRGEIARLEDLRLSATEQKLAAELALGRHTTVVGRLEVLTTRYPLRERLWANLMLAMYRTGRQAEALEAFARVREILAEELGIDPSPELRELHERILRQDPELRGPEATSAARATSHPAAGELAPGTGFAGYRIESVLGRGGMSVVYLAEHLALQRKVALKILSLRLAEDARFRDRFVRESRIAAGIEHPNIVPIYEAGEAEGLLFLAMRYIPGTDLGKLLRAEGTLEAARATRIVQEVAAALDAAHRTGLVHRDVKPGNILVVEGAGSEGRDLVYLSDFGLTKRLEGHSAGFTDTGQFVGTIDYVAPEQIEGRALDGRADVYSLACVLFECLTGAVPYRRESEVAALYAHLRDKPPKVTPLRPDLSPGLDKVFASGLSKLPTHRFATCGELAAAARAELDAVSASTTEVTAVGARRRVPALAMGGAALALIAVLVLATRSRSPASEVGPPPTAAVAPSSTPAPDFRTLDRPPNAAEQQLLTLLPAAMRQDCRPLDRTGGSDVAAVVCSATGMQVLYERFPTREAMYGLFDTNVAAHDASEGNCATRETATMPYTIGGQPAGRMLCYRASEPGRSFFLRGTSDRSHIEWTDERTLIYGHAVRDDPGDLTLFDWWLSSSGPIAGTSDDGVKDPPAHVAPRLPGGSYLLQLSPQDVAASGLGSIGGIKGVTAKQGWGGTWAISVGPSSYELAHQGDVVESGTTALQKPNVVLFTPTAGDCSIVEPDPSSYRWSASGATITWTRGKPRACAGPQPLTDRTWVRAPRGQILYQSYGDLFVSDAAGLHRQKVTDVNLDARSFVAEGVWSPDGQRIAYAGQSQGRYGIYAMNADGSDPQKLTEVPENEWDPSWSPDGTEIVFHAHQSDYGFTPSRIDAVGAVDQHVRSLYQTPRNAGHPAWSPDGSTIVFVQGSGVYTMASDGSAATLIHRGTKQIDTPTWTPDGSRIVFWDPAKGSRGCLFSMRPDGTDVRPLFPDLAIPGRSLVASFSPDGRWLVISQAWYVGQGNAVGASYPVYLVSSDGRRTFTIVEDGFGSSWRPGTT